MSDITEISAVALAEAIRTGQVSAVEAVEAVLARIEAQRRLNAFITVSAERARQEARHADARLARGDTVGPLHGVPLSVKDLTSTEGVRTSFGSRLNPGFMPTSDAVTVARARRAGAIMIGKTTTPEFGHKPFTEGPLFGRTLNPWREDVTCGGSSGGAAVAVAARMGPLALGTDGGGSIRIPAACCGVVGLKPTLGAVPNLQPQDLFAANSYVGPMARNVADTRLLFDAVVGPDTGDPYGQAAPQKPAARSLTRIGWLLACGNTVDPEVERVTSAAIELAPQLGLAVKPVEIDFVALEQAFLVILRTTLAGRLAGMAEKSPQKFDPTLLATIEAGQNYSATDLVEAQNTRTAFFRKVQALFERVDAIASPTLSAPPLPVGTDPHAPITIAGREFSGIRGAWYPYTYPFNLTGHPALSLPCGLTHDGLPLGLQLVGRWHEDHLLLDLAGKFEAAIGFSARPPQLAKENALA
jgi:aspartyl-tRNA(Asn)/glutamyl-tRNA(Gln) amidotransferase subunit A